MMRSTRLSEAQEDYLKQIFLISKKSDKVTTNHLSGHLNVKPASVTNMLKRLSELGLVEHKPYYGVTLTEAGQKVALEILRHHRLLELYLAEVHGYSWDEVHEEAERLEHVISERFEARIAEKLGHPTHDPHGDPIPSVDLELPESPRQQSLQVMRTGEKGVITRVTSQDSDFLNMLSQLGLLLNSRIEVMENSAKGVRVKTGNQQYLIPADMARSILISEFDTETTTDD